MSAKRVLCLLIVVFLTMAVGIVATGPGRDVAADQGTTSAAPLSTLSGEVQLSPDGNGERYRPAVVYNYVHREYLAVWHNVWPGGQRDIYARRVSEDGRLLSWFCVTTGAERKFQPAIAYNARDDAYLVVWMQESSANVYEIWGRIIPWNGPGTSADFKIVSWANRSFWTPRVAWNGYRDEYFVVWNAFDTTASFPPGIPRDIAGLRVSAEGVVQNPGSPLILTMYAKPHQVDLVYNIAMDEYFLVFVVVYTQGATGNDIYGLRVSWNGTPVNPPGLIQIYEDAKDQNAPAIATNEQDRYMVVWEHDFSPTDTDIYGREYYANGSPVGSYFTIASWTDDTTAPDVAANGRSREWLVVWQRALGAGAGYAVKGFRWGQGVPTYYFDVANYVYWDNENPAVASGVVGYLTVYEGDSSMTNRHIYGRVWWPQVTYIPRVNRNAQ